jgi:hypothetical protein
MNCCANPAVVDQLLRLKSTIIFRVEKGQTSSAGSRAQL